MASAGEATRIIFKQPPLPQWLGAPFTYLSNPCSKSCRDRICTAVSYIPCEGSSHWDVKLPSLPRWAWSEKRTDLTLPPEKISWFWITRTQDAYKENKRHLPQARFTHLYQSVYRIYWVWCLPAETTDFVSS